MIGTTSYETTQANDLTAKLKAAFANSITIGGHTIAQIDEATKKSNASAPEGITIKLK